MLRALLGMLLLVAEDAAYAPIIRHPKVAEAVAPIAGCFKVLRIEVGGLQMPLRQIITLQLERFLEKLGVDYTFPTADKELNNKDSFEEMMTAFGEKFPGQGVLLVVDEFLEYLQSRRDHELVQDLAILRQIGEVTKHLKFRFVAGVQEAIFDSVRFQHVADSMRRVNGRAVSQSVLRQIGELLIDAHGQSEHLSLLRVREHVNLLDTYAGGWEMRKGVAEKVAALRETRKDIDDITAHARERARRVDMLKFQLEEIRAARLKPNEEEALTEEHLRLAGVFKIVDAAVLEEPVHDAAHRDVFAHALHAGPQTADAAHDQVDLHPSLRRAVQRLDQFRLHQ